MQWYNEPATWATEGETINVVTDTKTDFWRKTHYGFVRDNGHFYWEAVTGDFVAEVKVTAAYQALYDQAGLMIRSDEATWMKCGVEFVDGVQNASVVITRLYSDWSVLPLASSPPSFWVRVSRHAGDVEVHYSLDGSDYRLLRVAHLTSADPLQVGIMCASPEGPGFSATFESFQIRPSISTINHDPDASET